MKAPLCLAVHPSRFTSSRTVVIRGHTCAPHWLLCCTNGWSHYVHHLSIGFCLPQTRMKEEDEVPLGQVCVR